MTINIVLIGKRRVGKDTVAQYLKEVYEANLITLAKPMKVFIQDLFGWSDEYLEHHKDEVDPQYGISYRQVMTALGTDFFQFILGQKFPDYKNITGRSIHVKRAIREVQIDKINVITDCRMLHELHYIKQKLVNAIFVKVDRTIERTKAEDEHVSEKEVDELSADYIIYNNGTFNELYNNIDSLMNTIFTKMNYTN
jgi:dephospho-CoA kinase